MLRHYIPTFSKLRKSLKLRSKEYLRENTLAGFPYFVDSTRPIYERICWFICTLASLCAAIAIIVVIYNRFEISPTITGLDIQTDKIASNFPSIHLCMTTQQFDMSLIPENLRDVYKALYDWNWNQLDFNIPQLSGALSETFLNVTPQCNKLITECQNSDDEIAKDCDKVFKKVITPAGICCTSPSNVIDVSNATFFQSFFYSHKQTLNFYTSPFNGESPLRDEPTYLYTRNVILEYHILITVAVDGLRVLPESQRSCRFPDEGPTYRNCISDCFRQATIKTCGCVPWFLKKVNSDYTECESSQYSCLINNRISLEKPKCLSKCYLYCSRSDYSLDAVKNSNRTEISTRWPRIAYKREVRFGWLDLVVSFGGIMGLFLGYSLLTTVELAYYFSLRLYCGAVMDKDNKINDTVKIKVASKDRKKSGISSIDFKYFDYTD